MKCSEVRSLFSSRVDEELDPETLASLDRHMILCEACGIAWINFRATVELLHGLPEESAEPSFVGQVLDRVRAFELQDSQEALDPVDSRPTRAKVDAWVDSVREWFRLPGWLQPAPALAVGCLCVGLLVGAVGSRFARNEVEPNEVATQVQVEPELVSPVSDRVTPAPPRPFADLADEVRTQEPAGTLAVPVDLLSPNWNGGLQQQVRYENDAARIIF